MKKLFIFCSCILFAVQSFAQSIGINNNTPHSSAILDVKSNTKGMLLPRTSTTSRNAIVNPAKGLLLYDTTTSGFWFHNGTAWASLAGSSGWGLTGNAATATNFIGTTNNQPLRFRVNNTWAGEIHPTSGNVFLGVAAGQANSAGQGNTAVGDHSLFANTDGNFNASVGSNALQANSTGYNNSALGAYSLTNNTTGADNTAAGRNSLFANTTGSQNTAFGKDALLTNITGAGNTANGYQALYFNNAFDNTAFGAGALYANTSGNKNVAVGTDALAQNQTGNYNTGNGFNALRFNTTGNNNTATGANALTFNSTGRDNTASGFLSLWANNGGSNNTASGSLALYNNTSGDGNTASGYQSLYSNTTGFSNVAMGGRALYSNTTGYYNIASSADALYSNTTGANNIASGLNALRSNTTGSANIGIGANALSNLTTGVRNIALGADAGTAPGSPNVQNTISIGNIDILNGASNQVIIGNFSSTGYYSNNPWATFSDARIKTNIKEEVKGLDFIMRLKPVTYHKSINEMVGLTGNKKMADFPGKYDIEKIKFSGFLAQEVEQAAIASGYDFSGLHKPQNKNGLYALSYETFVVPLVKAIQEQQVLIEKLTKQVEQNKKPAMVENQQLIIEEFKKQITEMKNEIELLKKKN
ncbi:MAG: tail fiber domain-containing protein [Ferruginibacter sp.]